MKTRYSKPFESVQVEIPYETGMSPYSGLTEFFEAKGALKKSGTRLEYISPVTGEVITQFRKVWDRNDNNCLDLVMEEWEKQPEDVQDAMGEEQIAMAEIEEPVYDSK